MKQAVIYTRVSSRDQVENYSPGQLTACTEYCQRAGYEVARVFVEEGGTAKTADRTEFQKLLAFCAESKGRVHALVVYNLSRFARDRFDQSPRPGADSAPGDRAALGHRAGGRDAVRRADGRDPGSHAPVRAPAPRRAHPGRHEERVAGGPVGVAGAARLSPGDQRPARAGPGEGAADALGVRADRLGQLQPGGGPPAGQRARPAHAAGNEIGRGPWHKMVRNPLYGGRVVHAGWGIEAEADFEALVPRETFQRAQRVLSGLKRVPGEPLSRKLDHPDFPLRRFIRCGACGTPLTAAWSRGNGGRYAYYFCRQPESAEPSS